MLRWHNMAKPMVIEIKKEISNSPYNGLQRRAYLLSSEFRPFEEQIIVKYLVQYIKDGEILTAPGINGYEKVFIIDRNHMVDEGGNVVQEGGIATEFDFYVMAINNGYNYFTQHEDAITILDANGRFN